MRNGLKTFLAFFAVHQTIVPLTPSSIDRILIMNIVRLPGFMKVL
jgi:hypothetical protein